ncbi:MAG: putative chitinase [Chitinophagaceae bacterium]|nr:putative chitinase [Chitinophagaceae bacterium]
MKKYSPAILFSLFLLFSPLSHAQFRVVGYLPNWGTLIDDASAVDFTKLTHLNIAFINPTDATGTLAPTTDLSTVVSMAHTNNVKVLASIGGANLPTYYSTLLTAANRGAFIHKLIQFTLTYNLDGIDVDFEGSAVNGNYEPFVVLLKDSLQAHGKLMTAAVGTWFGGSITSTALAQFDYINIMTYDKTGPWAPYSPGQHSSYQFALDDITYWSGRGLTADKMVLGVPFYGYYFGTYSTTYFWSQIPSLAPSAINDDEIYFLPSGDVLYYNGLLMIKRKTELALNKASGIMIWELRMDTHDANSLLTAINDVVDNASGNLTPTTALTAPSNGTTFAEGTNITLSADAADTDGSIVKVEFYVGTLKIGQDLTAPYSITWNNACGGGSQNLTTIAYDNLGASDTSGVSTVTISNASPATAFGGTRWGIPGKIEAENFNLGANGTAYYDNTATNQGNFYRETAVDIEHAIDANGGYDVGWTSSGEWMEYDVTIASDNNYSISVRAANGNSGTQNFHIEMDGVNVTGAISIPATGAWQKWSTVTVNNISLTQGDKKMRIAFDGGFNLNFVNFSSTTAITSSANASGAFHAQVYPNPASGSATLSLTQIESAETRISLFDQLNREVKVISNGYFYPGDIQVPFSTSDLAAGIYFCKIVSNNQTETIKLIKE